jgi:hypothetical protein
MAEGQRGRIGGRGVETIPCDIKAIERGCGQAQHARHRDARLLRAPLRVLQRPRRLRALCAIGKQVQPGDLATRRALFQHRQLPVAHGHDRRAEPACRRAIR